jgi:geranylgeranyl pyrophosphate synthase
VCRAIREVCESGALPSSDRIPPGAFHADPERLDLGCERATLRKADGGSYELSLRAKRAVSCRLRFTPVSAPQRYGKRGVLNGWRGERLFHYFVPRCRVSGELELDGRRSAVEGFGGYDRKLAFSRRQARSYSATAHWIAALLVLDDGTRLVLYQLRDDARRGAAQRWLSVIDPRGERYDYPRFACEPTRRWRSVRTFREYDTGWKLRVPEAGIELCIDGVLDDQEIVGVIATPTAWAGRAEVSGRMHGAPVHGVGFVELGEPQRVDSLDGFFSAVAESVGESVRRIYPLAPRFEQVRDLVGGEERESLMEGIDLGQFARAVIAPVREIVDRGGKSWRSYGTLACIDIVGGDSREFVQWLAIPEFMHVGSLIVDDVEDRSEIRRGGPACHLKYGEAVAINAGTAAYFMWQKLLECSDKLSDRERLRIYGLYFDAMRAGHAGQAIDLDGCGDLMRAAVETGEGKALEGRILAIHRLKTGVPASALAQMGAVAGGGSDEQIAALGRFFEHLGIAFQIIDDVLNLRGFKGNLKALGEDIALGKVTLPVAKAIPRLALRDREWLWNTLQQKPSDPAVIAACIRMLEECGAVSACIDQAAELVERGWTRLDRVVDGSFGKVMLRAFGWYVLERHY